MQLFLLLVFLTGSVGCLITYVWFARAFRESWLSAVVAAVAIGCGLWAAVFQSGRPGTLTSLWVLGMLLALLLFVRGLKRSQANGTFQPIESPAWSRRLRTAAGEQVPERT